MTTVGTQAAHYVPGATYSLVVMVLWGLAFLCVAIYLVRLCLADADASRGHSRPRRKRSGATQPAPEWGYPSSSETNTGRTR